MEAGSLAVPEVQERLDLGQEGRGGPLTQSRPCLHLGVVPAVGGTILVDLEPLPAPASPPGAGRDSEPPTRPPRGEQFLPRDPSCQLLRCSKARWLLPTRKPVPEQKVPLSQPSMRAGRLSPAVPLDGKLGQVGERKVCLHLPLMSRVPAAPPPPPAGI